MHKTILANFFFERTKNASKIFNQQVASNLRDQLGLGGSWLLLPR